MPRPKILASTLHYDLHKPCSDCPFRRDVPMHEGIAVDLPQIMDDLRAGTFAHTCHKTDPRSDSAVGQAADGPAQHCAGALLMVLKTTSGIADQEPMSRAAADGRLDLGALDWRNAGNIYDGPALVVAYDKFARDLARQRGAHTIFKVKRHE